MNPKMKRAPLPPPKKKVSPLPIPVPVPVSALPPPKKTKTKKKTKKQTKKTKQKSEPGASSCDGGAFSSPHEESLYVEKARATTEKKDFMNPLNIVTDDLADDPDRLHRLHVMMRKTTKQPARNQPTEIELVVLSSDFSSPSGSPSSDHCLPLPLNRTMNRTLNRTLNRTRTVDPETKEVKKQQKQKRSSSSKKNLSTWFCILLVSVLSVSAGLLSWFVTAVNDVVRDEVRDEDR